jgi:hypothetical protein
MFGVDTITHFSNITERREGPGWRSPYSDLLRAGRPGGSNPRRGGGGAGFSAPVRTGPAAHSASCKRGTGSFMGVKRPVLELATAPPSNAEANERVHLYLCSPLGLRSVSRSL